MNRKEFIAALAEHYDGDRRKAVRALDAVTHTLTEQLARGESVTLPGFGAFDTRVLKARWVRNPRTGEKLRAQATAVARFRPGAQLKGVVAGRRDVPPRPVPPPRTSRAKGRKK